MKKKEFDEAYIAAREEILERIKLRDTAILQYVFILSMAMAFIVKENINNIFIMLLISLFSIIISLIYFHHNLTIGNISYFIRTFYLEANFDYYVRTKTENSVNKIIKKISKYIIIIFPYILYSIYTIFLTNKITIMSKIIVIITILINAFILYNSDKYHK